MSCVVAECSAPAQAAVILPIVTDLDPDERGPWSVTVCKFHEQALYAGEQYDLGEDGVLYLGTNTPPRLLSFEVATSGLSMPVVTLHLGHDGVVSQTVPIQVSPEFAEYLSLGADSELAKETGRNAGPESGTGA